MSDSIIEDMVVYNCNNTIVSVIDKPSFENVKDHLDHLGEDSVKAIYFYTQYGYLTIHSSSNPKGRIFLQFSNGADNDGILLDTNVTDEISYTFLLESNKLKTFDQPIQETIDKETASQVTLYLYLHSKFPEEVVWKGNVII